MKKQYAQYLLKKTTQDYDLIAKDFSRTRARIWEEIRFLFDDYLKPNDKVLDLGCGNGRYFETVNSKNIDYYGVDNSEKLIEIAREKYPKAKFQVADALNLPFNSNFFDKVYAIAVLHHIPSKELRLRFLNEAKRVLKPGGLLILTVWKFSTRKEINLILKHTFLKVFGFSTLDFKDVLEPWGKTLKRYYHCFSQAELIKLIKESGFQIKEKGIVKKHHGKRQNIYLVANKKDPR